MGKKSGAAAVNGFLWEGDIVHLVFQQEAAEALEKSFELDDCAKGNVIVLKEDYSVGNIADIFEAEGWQKRRNFWKNIDEAIPLTEEENDAMTEDKLSIHNLLKDMQQKPDLHLWIWMGQNEQDVCGYYWLISQLAALYGRVHVLYLNNLPFINEKGGIFYPARLAEILPREFVKARKLTREVSVAEFELDTEEWKKLCAEDAFVRTLEGGKKIVSQPGNYYDQQILKVLGKESCRLPRLLANVSSKLKIQKPAAFWIWRIKHLLMNDTLLMSGDWQKQKDIVLKINSGELFGIVEEEQQNKDQ